jgi:Peptide methionine sulfoxide reductase
VDGGGVARRNRLGRVSVPRLVKRPMSDNAETAILYRDILEFFFQIHDPTTKDRQGNDFGSSYRSEIFTRAMSSARSPRTRSPTSRPPACGRARS